MDRHHSHRQKQVPAHILHHLQAQVTSGKSIKDYSIGEGLSPLTFYDWRKRYGNRLGSSIVASAKQCKPPQSFTTVGTMQFGERREPLFDIHFTDGTRVSIYHGTTARELAPFLKLLSVGARSC